jgi:glycosyltransferase involved in cell wall biosynthesis
MIVPSMEPGGQEMVVARLARGLRVRGYDVGIACLERMGKIGAQLREDGFSVRLVPTPGIRTIFRPTALESWFQHRRPDVIHTHSGAWLKGGRARHRAGVSRHVHTIHGLMDREPWHGPPLMRWASRHTDEIAAVSEPLRDYLRQVVRVGATPIHVVPNGVDTRRFHPGPPSGQVRDRFRLSASTIVIGHVARLAPIKNQELLLRAFAILHAEQPDVFLAIAGDGPLRSRLEELGSSLAISERVGFLGHVTDLPSVYRDFDVFALSSLAEGTSISIQEAMATGLAIVATAVGGTPHLVADGEAGVLAASNDVDALADALRSVIADTSLRERIGQAARRRATAVYGEDTMLDQYEALYHGAHVPVRSAG